MRDRDIVPAPDTSSGAKPVLRWRHRHAHRAFYVIVALLVIPSAILVWHFLYRPPLRSIDLGIGLAAVMLALALIVAIEVIQWDERAEAKLQVELQHSRSMNAETRHELQNIETGHQYLFETNPTPMWVFDLKTLRFLAVNDAAARRYGYSREEFLDMTIMQIRDEEDTKDLAGYLRIPRPAFKSAGVWKHRRKDGRILYAEVASHDINWHGRKGRFVCATDVTESLQAQNELRKMNTKLELLVDKRTQELKRANGQLEEMNRELEAFAHSVSHDLRTPLFVLTTFTEMLLKDDAGVMGGSGREYLLKIQEAERWMASMIDSLLRLAKASRSAIKRRPLDISALAQELGAVYRSKDPARSTSFDIQAQITANADPELVRIVLDNLLGNAWKFTAKTPAAKIEVGAQNKDNERVIFIRDNGVGFDMRDADKLFIAFQRLHGDAEFEGHGIGLTTVQRIIARHGGRIWVESTVDKGSTFYFTLGDANVITPIKAASSSISAHGG